MKRAQYIIIVLVDLFIVLYASPIVPQNSSTWIREGDVLWKEREEEKKIEEAINAYKKALEINPNN